MVISQEVANLVVVEDKAGEVLVLLHGSGWHSKYLFPLAKYISSENLAHVYTPDLRGHGINPIKRGDI